MCKSIIWCMFVLLRIIIVNSITNQQKDQRILTFSQDQDVNQSQERQDQGLWNAAGIGRLFDVNSFLTSGANPNWVNRANQGMVALHQAAKFNHAEVAKSLLDHRAIVDLQDFGNRTPLAEAAFYGSTDVINILIDKGADISIPTGNGYSPLMRTINRGQFSSAEALINAHANLEYEDEGKKTALHWAVQYNKPAIAKLLIQAGADKNKKDKLGRTPEDIARWLGHTDLANIIGNLTSISTQTKTVTTTSTLKYTTIETIKTFIISPTDPSAITTKTPKADPTEKPIITSETTGLLIVSANEQQIASDAIDSSIPIIVGSIIMVLLLIGLLAIVFIHIKKRNSTNREDLGLGELSSQQTDMSMSMASRHDSVNSLYDRVETQAPDHDSHNDSENNNCGAILTKEKIEFNFI